MCLPLAAWFEFMVIKYILFSLNNENIDNHCLQFLKPWTKPLPKFIYDKTYWSYIYKVKTCDIILIKLYTFSLHKTFPILNYGVSLQDDDNFTEIGEGIGHDGDDWMQVGLTLQNFYTRVHISSTLSVDLVHTECTPNNTTEIGLRSLKSIFI